MTQIICSSLIICFFINCSSNLPENQIPDVAQPTLDFVNFCDLVNNPQNFDRKIIRTRAVILEKFETAILYHRDCADMNKVVWYEIDGEIVNKKLDDFFTPDSAEFKATGVIRLEAELVGRFQLKKETRFGHLNAFDFQMSIVHLDGVKYADANYPYPWK